MFKKTKIFFLWFVPPLFLIFQFYYYVDFGKYRNLTAGEIEFLSEVYGSSIEYSDVKIYPRKFFISPIQNDNIAMAPNGNIYFSESYFYEDFSKENIYDQAWLVHELMHVYQYEQRGQFFAWEGAGLIIRSWLSNFNPYKYSIDVQKQFSDYNIEQQGDIARDYFLFLKGEKIFSKKEIQWYEKVLFKH